MYLQRGEGALQRENRNKLCDLEGENLQHAKQGAIRVGKRDDIDVADDRNDLTKPATVSVIKPRLVTDVGG